MNLTHFENKFRTHQLILLLCWFAFFSTHMARMNWAVLIPFSEAELGFTKTMSGLLLTAPFFMYALMQIPVGILADRFKNEKLMGVGLIATGTITCLTGFFTGFTELFVLRLLTGFAASFVYTPSLRLLLASFKKTEKGKAIGLFHTGPTTSLIVLGFIIPPLALNYGWRWGFFVAGIPGILTGILTLLTLRAFIWNSNDSSFSSAKRNLWTVFTNRNLLFLFLGNFFADFAASGARSWLVDYLIADIGIASVLAGMIYSVFNFINVLNKPLSGWAVDKVKKTKPLILGSLATISFLLFLIALRMDVPISIFLILCLGMVLSFQIPISVSLANKLSSSEILGVTLSTHNMMGMIGFAVQPALTGYILDVTGVYAWIWMTFAILVTTSMVCYALLKE